MMSQGGSSSRLPRVIWTGKQTDDWYDDVRGGCSCFWRHRVKCTWKQTDDRHDDDVRGGQATADCPKRSTQGNRKQTDGWDGDARKVLLQVTIWGQTSKQGEGLHWPVRFAGCCCSKSLCDRSRSSAHTRRCDQLQSWNEVAGKPQLDLMQWRV